MSEHQPENDRGIPSPVSRRRFLLAAGTTAAVSLPTMAASGTTTGELTIDGSPMQLGFARRVKEQVQRTHSSVSVSLSGSGTTAGLRRFAAGELDVVVGSRPILPAEHERATTNGIRYASREAAIDTIALVQSEQAWYECLSASQVAEQWAGDAEVETWAEIESDVTATTATTDQSAGKATTRAPPGSKPRIHRSSLEQDRPILVRGVRAYQYATGFGGLGYYEPNTDDLTRLSSTASQPAYTPLVRLMFLYATQTALQQPAVTEFIGTYSSLSDETANEMSYFKDPYRTKRARNKESEAASI